MKRFLLAFLSFLFAAGVPEAAIAHGVGYILSEKTPVALEFFYSSGEPMSYAKADVYAPGEKGAFQSGRTDEKGRLAFVPEVEGEWRVVVADDEGHRAEARVSPGKAGEDAGAHVPAAVSGGRPAGALDNTKNAILGVSLIFNLASVTLLYRARRRGHAH